MPYSISQGLNLALWLSPAVSATESGEESSRSKFGYALSCGSASHSSKPSNTLEKLFAAPFKKAHFFQLT